MQDKSNRKVMKDQARKKIEKLLSEKVTFMDLKTKQASKYFLEPNVRKYLVDQLQALIQEQEQEIPEADWGKEFDKNFNVYKDGSFWVQGWGKNDLTWQLDTDKIKQFIAKQIEKAEKKAFKKGWESALGNNG